jgi:thymidylate synthase ThyX
LKELSPEQCTVKIIADSYSKFTDSRVTTFELEYPRFIHSELMTHRNFSRNASSSRAVPVNSVLDQLSNDVAAPVFWGKNQSGMQSYEELDDLSKKSVQGLWLEASKMAYSTAKVLSDMKVHKQVINRITEPFQHIKVVVTSTDYDNFFKLRCHHAADPTMQQLANKMKDAYLSNEPEVLEEGDWHLPYIDKRLIKEGGLSLEDALKISVSCCCQVSYRKQDMSLDKANKIFEMLNLSSETEPAHASPTEHQAMCINDTKFGSVDTCLQGITHLDRKLNWYSGNFRGFVQYRQLLGV